MVERRQTAAAARPVSYPLRFIVSDREKAIFKKQKKVSEKCV